MKHNRKVLAITVFVLSFFLIVLGLPNTLANNRVHEISTFEELVEYAALSRTAGYESDTYMLLNDINITEENQSSLEASDFKYISFGSSDVPFSGTFDGNGYTISNLKYDKSVVGNKYDTGLIAQSNGATIKNLVIDNADIDAVFRGGIVVGYANNTLIENVVVKNSHISLSAADNIVTLVTDGGVRGGALVGDAFNTTIYNCEGYENFVNINNTSGVAALAGKGLTVAGLVGISNNTTVEYSRVIGGTVKNYYDVAVGALGGNNLYVGGIVGQMQESSKIIDSYSTAELNYYCATYVAVGAGNVGNLGGITAKMDGDKNEIYRSHYAGVATSRQYNAVLVVPIIQNNLNISGITESYGGGAVVNTYFKPSLNPDVKMKVLGDSSSTSSYGPLSDDKYTNKDFWQEKGYDFSGTTKRTSSYSSEHYNKWVMDYNTGMPVHGKSVSATFDFPGAGTVIINKTSLIDKEVSTSTPYYFATQGLKPNEYLIDVSATENEGYKFISWYKVPKISAWQLEENHEFFDYVFSKYEPISTDKLLTGALCDDNNLFVAYYKANVLYHDINGDLISANTGIKKTEVEDDDWYDYEDKILSIVPHAKPSSETAKLIGWTTIKSNEAGGGYSNISSPELSSLKSSNAFYEAGDIIKSALSLYPVYADLVSNITTVFEGNEQDSIDNVSLRDGVGKTSVSVDNNKVVLNVEGDNNGSFPTGYRFLGWYDEENHKISSNEECTIDEIDLNETYTFTARFEYKVEYYVRAFKQNNQNAFTNSTLFAEKWQTYNSEFDNIGGPSFVREYVTHWGTSHMDHGSNTTDLDKYSSNIVEPIKVYSHNYSDISGNGTGYALLADTDFPSSGSIIDEVRDRGVSLKFTPVSDRYHLEFWTLERNNNSWTYSQNPLSDWLSNLTEYKARAFVTADIIFHSKEDELTTVRRRYNTNVFMNSDESYTYYYPHIHTTDVVKTSASDSGSITNPVTFKASPSDSSMKKSGYAFLGWISSNDVEKDSDEWNYIYDIADDSYTTSSVSKVEPYVIKSTDNIKVESTLDLYPVYAKYNIETKTKLNLDGITTNINYPSNPEYELSNDEINKIITIKPDLDTYVKDGEPAKFSLKYITISENGKDEVEILPINGEYTYEIKPGNKYIITAYYEPYVIIYHNDEDDVDIYIKNNGDELGVANNPTYDVSTLGGDYVFAGWSKDKPEGDFHAFDSYNNFETSGINMVYPSTLVDESMELWAVYISANINYNSNIDTYLLTKGIMLTAVRNAVKTSADTMTLKVLNEKIDNYKFMGWYKNYVSESSLGTLISTSPNYDLTRSEMFDDGYVYTAVYKKVYEVTYYDTNNDVITVVNVEDGDDRTFIVTNEDGTTSPTDYDAFIQMYEKLNQNEYLVNWQWVKDDGTKVPWDNFKDYRITHDMNLYPVINEITAYDANGNTIDVTGDDSKILFGVQNEDVVASLNYTYNMPTLKLHINELSYDSTGSTSVNASDVNVKFYKDDNKDELLDERKTDNNGDAIFEFYGVATITKNKVNDEEQTFIFNIINENEPNVVVKKITIKEGHDVKVKLPYGSYIVTEDKSWAWRYNATVDGNIVINNNSNSVVNVKNSTINNKWFDGAAFNKNKYK